MKEKINLLAKGIFEYQTKPVAIHPEKLELKMEAGQSCNGSFLVSSGSGDSVKGFVCTECDCLNLEMEVFQGSQNEIPFSFCGENFMPGEVITGSIRIVTNQGSRELPFSVTVTVPSCPSSAGKMRDLLHFANLAEENFREAVSLFQNPQFEKVFLHRDSQNQEIYRGLAASTSKATAMEEFLAAVHKKLPVQLTVEKNIYFYRECKEVFQDKIVLHKDNWGFEEFTVTVDSRFIELEQKNFHTGQFVGNIYKLPFILHPERMRNGRNYGRILVSGIRQTLSIQIEARRNCDMEQVNRLIQTQNNRAALCEAFINFRRGLLSLSEYSTRIESAIYTMKEISFDKEEDNWIAPVFRIHLAMLKNQEETMAAELAFLQEKEEELRENSPVTYCGYLYMRALYEKKDAVSAECVRNIRECYLSREHSWQVLWFLLYLDPVYESARKKQEDIMEQLCQGCHSPVAYFEMCSLLNEAPGLLLDLDAQVRGCLHWGCENQCISRELALRYSFLAGRQKSYSGVILKDMRTLYHMYSGDDLLTVICKMQMHRNKVIEGDLKWYSLGIERNLKITDLYEYYIYASDERLEQKLPSKVLLYFLYNNHLNAGKRAALYAYIIRHREENEKRWMAYRPIIQEFTLQQLREERISPDLALLYQEFINEETLNAEIAAKLPAVMFSYEITCYHSDIVGIYLHRPELEQEDFIPLIQGRAVLPIFTPTQIYLANRQGNRYMKSIDYTVHKLLHLDYLAQKCLEYSGDDHRLLLHLYEKADSMQQSGDHVVELRKRVLEIPVLSKRFRKKVFASQVRSYFDNFEGDLLDHLLHTMDWSQVDIQDRAQFIEYCAIRHCNEKAMEGILQFGYDHVEVKRLLRVSSDVFMDASSQDDPKLLKLAWYIFENGQFNGNILSYLCRCFVGEVCDMIKIWEAAEGFLEDTADLTERILAQAVFTGELEEAVFHVFFRYVEKGSNKKLIRAFLKWTAYEYLVHERELPEKMFSCFLHEVRVEENRPCLLAALKYLSGKEVLKEEEILFSDYNLHRLYENHIIFGFYKNFYEKIPLPEQLMKEQFVEYTANPAHEVKIVYRIRSGKEESEKQTLMMEDMFEGIRVKGFVLFQNESLEYSIVEITSEGEEKEEGPYTLTFDSRTEEESSKGWYSMLNQMLALKEKGDDKALIEVMHEYAQKKETVDQLIRPLS